MATQAERKTETKRKLIDAAKQLFDEHGFDAVSVNQIVKLANVAKGTFYQYYETKDDVLADVCRDEGVDKFREALDAVENGTPALEILEKYINFQCDWFESNKHIAEAIIRSALKSVGADKSEDAHRHSRVFLAKLMMLAQSQGVVRSDIDPREISKIIGSALVLTVLAWCKQPIPGALHTSMKQSIDIILNGIKVSE